MTHAEPLRGFWSPMRAAGPTAGTLFTFEELLLEAGEMFLPCLGLFHNRYIAYPLIARQRSERLPFCL